MSLFGHKPIQDSLEVQRVIGLPRRTWSDRDLEVLAREMTWRLKTRDGTMQLRPIQALALHDIGVHGGLFAPIGVGEGKTLIAFLAPYLLEAQRPVLMTRACLLEKTERERKMYAAHWRLPTNLRVISYEMMGRVGAARTLEVYQPDLIVLDETHRAKNKRAGVTKRLLRYLREHPDTRVVAMSGTIMKNSLKNFAHILRWALKDGAPIPRKDGELEEWADALDEGVHPLARRDPGVLLNLAPANDTGEPIAVARRSFQRRLVETPGVVASAGTDGFTGSLYIRALTYPSSPATEANFLELRKNWMTPDGWALSMAAEVWAKARELALGFHYVWDPRPPPEWLEARRVWAAFVREILSHSRTLDTEKQVALACQSGALGDAEFNAWTQIKPRFTRAPKALWHDDAALDLCQTWLEREPGIVWCKHVLFAQELSRRTGLSYYGADGLNANGEYIESSARGSSAIVSIDANQEGRNLQCLWSRNLITAVPDGKTLEQLIGRTHRSGQTADQVEVDVLLGCREHYDSWNKAVADSQMVRDVMGTAQKLLIADITFPSEDEVSRYSGFRWQKCE